MWASRKGHKGEWSFAQMRCRRSIRILIAKLACGVQTPVHAALAGRHKARASFRCYRTVMSFL